MNAGLNCDQTGSGYYHAEEPCMYTLSGTGGASINGEKFPLETPNRGVYSTGDYAFCLGRSG